ncbi:MAG: 2-aminobenzoate-CoA ligase, partial [Streptomyces sp.]|nr:2-aminobenzoate-CoA ligase [Streptomyces sp.]
TDAARGQVVVAYAVLRAGAHRDAEALRVFLKSELAPYKCPREIVFLEALPRTATGKLQRFRLRADAERVPGEGGRASVTSPRPADGAGPPPAGSPPVDPHAAAPHAAPSGGPVPVEGHPE